MQTFPSWLIDWMQRHSVFLWGAADLREFSTPKDEMGKSFPFAVSWAVPMNPEIMTGIQNGPNQTYADEYARVNKRINDLATMLATRIKDEGFQAYPLAAADRTDPVNMRGEFPHKTAATRAGLGWIGRNCQLVTRGIGPWLRLGTVFTDLSLPCGPPVEKSFCGHCAQCVDACPAKALTGEVWHPGVEREKILNVHKCDNWKRRHYFQFHKGHNCGICAAVCPFGLKLIKKKSRQY